MNTPKEHTKQKLCEKWIIILLILVSGCGGSDSLVPVDENSAYTEVSNSIVIDTVWNVDRSPYIVTDDILVERDVTLTIHPGVKVRFDGSYALIVKGILIADGMINDQKLENSAQKATARLIIFTSNTPIPEMNDWKGIKFYNTNNDRSILSATVIEYAEKGIECFSSSPQIRDCIIRNNRIGIYSYESLLLTVSHNVIMGNVSGIVSSNSRLNITKNTIAENENGIVAFSWATLEQNNILGNLDYGVVITRYHSRYPDIRASNNWWGTIETNLIAQQIYDGHDEPKLANVLYSPFAISKIIDACPRFRLNEAEIGMTICPSR